MSLRTRLCVTTTVLVLLLFGVSEFLTFRATSQFLDEHQALLERGADNATALSALQSEKERLFTTVTQMRLAYATLTVLLSVVAVTLLWYRMVLSPIDALLAHINLMKRGTWTKPIPVQGTDEIAELTSAFNHLGEQLTLTVHQFANASKLSAMALIGQRLNREIDLAVDHIRNITVLLRVSKEYQQGVPDAAVSNLELVAKNLKQIEIQLDSDFHDEIARGQRLPAGGNQKAGGISIPEREPQNV